MGRRASIDRDGLLNAAEALVAEQGAGKLTLDAVAERANVSKGGLQYSFPSKDVLIRAMLERMLKELDQSFDQALAAEKNGPSRRARAYVRGSVGDATRPTPLRTALLAAVATDPDLLAPQRQAYRDHIDQMVAEGLSIEQAATIVLATDGMWLLGLLGITPFDADEQAKIIDHLCRHATVKKGGRS
jgi:AcrR family transcriptional regulator